MTPDISIYEWLKELWDTEQIIQADGTISLPQIMSVLPPDLHSQLQNHYGFIGLSLACLPEETKSVIQASNHPIVITTMPMRNAGSYLPYHYMRPILINLTQTWDSALLLHEEGHYTDALLNISQSPMFQWLLATDDAQAPLTYLETGRYRETDLAHESFADALAQYYTGPNVNSHDETVLAYIQEVALPLVEHLSTMLHGMAVVRHELPLGFDQFEQCLAELQNDPRLLERWRELEADFAERYSLDTGYMMEWLSHIGLPYDDITNVPQRLSLGALMYGNRRIEDVPEPIFRIDAFSEIGALQNLNKCHFIMYNHLNSLSDPPKNMEIIELAKRYARFETAAIQANRTLETFPNTEMAAILKTDIEAIREEAKEYCLPLLQDLPRALIPVPAANHQQI
ncbi:hypothetical protein GC177_11025 [bacterium]|nr:hypothetical protein [bacterium]